VTAVLHYCWLAAGLHDKIISQGVGGHRVYMGICHPVINRVGKIADFCHKQGKRFYGVRIFLGVLPQDSDTVSCKAKKTASYIKQCKLFKVNFVSRLPLFPTPWSRKRRNPGYEVLSFFLFWSREL